MLGLCKKVLERGETMAEKQTEFVAMSEKMPEGDGFYLVDFDGDGERVVYLHDLRQYDFCEYNPNAPKDWDNPPPFNWGWDESDDPESLALDNFSPWGIMWKDLEDVKA